MIYFHNTGVEPIIIEFNKINILLNSNEKKTIDCDSLNCHIKIRHINNYKFNTLWYIMNELFTLEQMKTILIVDGEYTINSMCDNPSIKIKSQEYVFECNIAYQTFIFSTDGCSITRNNLEVANEKKINKRAKILYLFGGDKTLLPLTGIALIASLIKSINTNTPLWFQIMTFGLTLCFICYFIKYISALKKLKHAMKNENILKYLASQRKEYKKYTDKLVEQYLDVNTNERDIYS